MFVRCVSLRMKVYCMCEHIYLAKGLCDSCHHRRMHPSLHPLLYHLCRHSNHTGRLESYSIYIIIERLHIDMSMHIRIYIYTYVYVN
jgi:hypothetical protein